MLSGFLMSLKVAGWLEMIYLMTFHLAECKVLGFGSKIYVLSRAGCVETLLIRMRI